MDRLDKLLSGAGGWSRKEARALVKAGRVMVNGQRPAGPESKCSPHDKIQVDGETIACTAFQYIMLNKPMGYVSSTEDPRDPTVLHLLPPMLRRLGLFPVGRLDKDTVGLLLLTNDGSLAHRLLAPHRHVDKVYLVQVDGVLGEDDQEAFAAGMLLKDGTRCRPAPLQRLDPPNTGLVTLQEGKYHQVKRMFAARGKPVQFLKRLAMGPLQLDESLAPGQWRALTETEKRALESIP